MRVRTIVFGAALGASAGFLAGSISGEALPEPSDYQGDIVSAYAGDLVEAEVKILELTGTLGGVMLGGLTAASMEMQADATKEE